MEGGIHSWEGLRATGFPESGMVHFPESASAEELVALAWLLEEGSRKFYAGLPGRLTDKEAAGLFTKLVSAEERHKNSLTGLFRSIAQRELDDAFARSLSKEDVMEGGVSVPESLAWTEGRSLADVLAFALGLETNSYDLYIKMGRRVVDERSKEVFSALSNEEKGHLRALADLLDKKV